MSSPVVDLERIRISVPQSPMVTEGPQGPRMVMAPIDLMVTFNVGGHVFLVSKETLSKHMGQFTSTYLTALCDPYWNTGTVVPIDRNPALFGVVLEFLRHDRWRIPANIQPADVFDEMVFYGYIVPLCSVTARWHNKMKDEPRLVSQMTGLDPVLAEQAKALIARALTNGDSASPGVFVTPAADYLERQLAHLGLPGLKVKIADLFRTTLETAICNSALFDVLRSSEGAALLSYMAHKDFYESVIEVETWRLNLEVVSRPGSVANDYRLAAAKGDCSRGTGALVLMVTAIVK